MKNALCLTIYLVAAGNFTTVFAQTTGTLSVPDEGAIRVAFLVTRGANVIDFASPWEVFQDVVVKDKNGKSIQPFESYVVSDSLEAVRMTNGLRVLPDFTFDNAPKPHVIVVGAQSGSPRMLSWIKEQQTTAQITMSVCTGAFQLAKAGLLDGLKATTHHDFFDAFEKAFPQVQLQRGSRYVEGSESIATAGGLTSGFDMALRVVERYFGKQTADQTAIYMEYERR